MTKNTTTLSALYDITEVKLGADAIQGVSIHVN